MSKELVERLRRGVACERFGDMEPDIYSAESDMRKAADLIESQSKIIEEQTRAVNDRDYMLNAYRDLLGPKALELVAIWESKGVRRFHASWGPNAFELTGEERAQVLLDVERAPKTKLDFADGSLSNKGKSNAD